MWAYAYMKGWNKNENMEFDFNDAHDIKPLTDNASEDTVKRRLRERFSSAKQVIVLVGENTKSLFKFVRWEIDTALDLDLPIIVVNLNDNRTYDSKNCPTILDGKYVVHISYKMKIIQYALNNFPDEFAKRKSTDGGNRQYNDDVYKSLGLVT